MVTVRRAQLNDVAAIAEIYNEAVLHSSATFDTEPKSVEDRMIWLKNHDEGHPVIVAEEEGVVLGWASLSEWSDRRAYAGTAENSVYLYSKYCGRGVGTILMKALMAEARAAGLHTVIARIAGESEASVKLHESFGFTRIGRMKEVGHKFGRFHDVHLFQVLL